MLSSVHSFLQLESQLDHIPGRDRHRLSRHYRRLATRLQSTAGSDEEPAGDLQQQLRLFQEKLDNALAVVAERRAHVPTIAFDDDLPVSQKREAIAAAIEQHPVVVIAGETGSGKTTQLPKICLALERGVRGMIGHTQPRRLAARSVAGRIAEELNSEVGDVVGYQVRFSDRVSDKTAIKLMTDGILLAEIRQDRLLTRYDTIIIDEAHERSLNIDFLLGYLKQLLPKRPDLKVIITSATIDVEKFSRHFNDAPVIKVSGRSWPVSVHYRPANGTGSDSVVESIINTVHEITTLDHQGDILAFLPGEREIRETALQLRREQIPQVTVMPLYARLSIAAQNKMFEPHRGRRVVLATNVAETSLTVPGIRYVIDPGYARISRYSFRTKVQRLPVEAISQASANQRKGRCGRVSEGVCFRLYSEQEFLARPEFTDPEILRTNLAAVILQMAHLKLGDIRNFPFVDMPDHRLINDGYNLLRELQAIDVRDRLTPIGRQLSRLPVDPRLGRMLIEADRQGCLGDVITITSALSIQDPRERPADQQQAADQQHRRYWHEDSDFLIWLNLWQDYGEQRQQLSASQLRAWCRKRFLAASRMREWRDLHRQITLAVGQLSLRLQAAEMDYIAVHKALLSGLLGNIGYYSKDRDRAYLGARNRRFRVFPGSSQCKKSPSWIVAGELIETSKLYAHQVARIEAHWILDLAQHLVRRQYFEPHYHSASGQVLAYEKITLYGLVLAEKKAVSYSRIDPAECRKIFIRAALVEGRYADNRRIQQLLKAQVSTQQTADSHFFLRQQAIQKELRELEAKSRRRDILVDDEVLFGFYNERIPAAVINLDGFENWRKKAEQQRPRLLLIARSQLMRHGAQEVNESLFPGSIEAGGLHLPVIYQFDPSHRDDGVTLQVPVTALHLLTGDQLQWLVPGLLTEKITAMIRALPKQWRKQFAPVPSTVKKILPYCKNTGQSLTAAVSNSLLTVTGVQVPAQIWQAIKLDPFYHFNIHVLDATGRLLEAGRNLQQLRRRYRSKVQDQLQQQGNDFEKSGLTHWSFGLLPETHILKRNGLHIAVWPGLVDRGDSVDLRLFDNRQQATINSLGGLVRLAALSQPQTIKYLKKQLLKHRDLGLALVTMGKREAVIDDVIGATIRQICFDRTSDCDTLPRDPEAFSARVDAGRGQWVERAEAIESLLVAALTQVVEIKKIIRQTRNSLGLTHAILDVQRQLDGLFYPGCLYETPFEWLQQYQRYLRGILLRLEKVPRQVNQDRVAMDSLLSLWEGLQQKFRAGGGDHLLLNRELLLYRWMLEELRISLFAQTLKTRLPVSIKRLNKQFELC